jgi:predicted metalloprotease with PDZ domain
MLLPPSVSRTALAAMAILALLILWWARPVAEEPVEVVGRQRPDPPAPRLAVAVDASDLPRRLLRATVSWPAAPGRQWLRFPRWIQGTHAPCGQVENLAGLVVRDDHGTVLPWRRDPHDMHRFAVEVPAGSSGIALALTYIANQPSINSQPVDVLAYDGVAMLNWNNAVIHPEGWSDTALRVSASLLLPAGWRQASALATAAPSAGTIAFVETDLRTLLDSPVLCGRNLAEHELDVPAFAPHRLAVAAARDPGAPPPRALAQLRAVAAEGRELWGSAPFERYTWLLALGEDMPRQGLEHLSCSANGLTQEGWFEADGLESDVAFLLTHEYGHVWIGKHHRPAGMLTEDSHTPLDTSLLWVYEGFDQYTGMVLAARAGTVDRGTWMARLAMQIERVHANRSRAWRTLEDTATASHLLRGGCRSWYQLRGGQDYYYEGMLLCFEADGLIRRASGGTRRFDDVLARLFPTGAPGAVMPFTEQDVVAALRAVEPSVDWPALIGRRVRSTAAGADLSALRTWGMRAVWDDHRDEALLQAGILDDRWSAGVALRQGRVLDVVPYSPADAARLDVDTVILRVGDAPFSTASWDAALRTGSGPIRLRVRIPKSGESDVELPRPVRPRFLRIEPSDAPDESAILEAIIAPRSAEGRAVRAAGW